HVQRAEKEQRRAMGRRRIGAGDALRDPQVVVAQGQIAGRTHRPGGEYDRTGGGKPSPSEPLGGSGHAPAPPGDAPAAPLRAVALQCAAEVRADVSLAAEDEPHDFAHAVRCRSSGSGLRTISRSGAVSRAWARCRGSRRRPKWTRAKLTALIHKTLKPSRTRL